MAAGFTAAWIGAEIFAAEVVASAVIADFAIEATVGEFILGEFAVDATAGALLEAGLGDVALESFGAEFLASAAEPISAASAITQEQLTQTLVETGVEQSNAMSVASDVAAQNGVTTNAADFAKVAGDSTEALTETANGVGESVSTANPEALQTLPNAPGPGVEQIPIPEPAPPLAQQSGGIISDAAKWAKENPLLAMSAANFAGGMGKGMLAGDAANKKNAQDLTIAQNKTLWDLQAQQAASASSGAFNQNLGFSAPGQTRALTRPGAPGAPGAPVYAAPGIIAGQMNR